MAGGVGREAGRRGVKSVGAGVVDVWIGSRVIGAVIAVTDRAFAAPTCPLTVGETPRALPAASAWGGWLRAARHCGDGRAGATRGRDCRRDDEGSYGVSDVNHASTVIAAKPSVGSTYGSAPDALAVDATVENVVGAVPPVAISLPDA